MDCLTFQQFLSKFGRSLLEEFYQYPTTCVAVYHALPSLARHILIRLASKPSEPLTKKGMLAWCSHSTAEQIDEASRCLTELAILEKKSRGVASWEFSAIFKANYMKVPLRKVTSWSLFEIKAENLKHVPDLREMDKLAEKHWETILEYIVAQDVNEKLAKENIIGPTIVKLLSECDLMRNQREEGISVTRKGFQLLLLDTKMQILNLLLNYLDFCTVKGLSITHRLSILSQLSLSAKGSAFSIATLNEEMKVFINHLQELRLIYVSPELCKVIFTTSYMSDILSERFSTNLLHYNAENGGKEAGFIIAEKDCRLYAYTVSKIYKAMLTLFTEPKSHLPGIFVRNINRDSVRAAISMGITANQINCFLTKHAHEDVIDCVSHEYVPAVPFSLMKQIKEWETERKFMTFTPGAIFCEFPSIIIYEETRDYAHSLDTLIWEKQEELTLIVNDKKHEYYWRSFFEDLLP